MKFKNLTFKIIFATALFVAAGFFIYKGVAGPMKINMPDTNRLTSGLVGYWTFDGQDTNWGTNTTNDRSGNGYNGTMTSMSTSTSPAPGVAGQSLNFDGSASYVDVGIGSSITFDRYDTFSVSVWVKRGSITANTNYSIIGDYDNSTDTGWHLKFNDTNAILWAFIKNNAMVNYTTTNNTSFTSTTNWYHIVATYDGSNIASGMKIYVDGVSENVTPSSGSLDSFANSTSGTIGKGKFNGSNNLLFNGSIDEVRVYNRAISASEITELYQEGQTKINASQANKLTSGLVGYWPFDGNHMNWATTYEALDKSGQGVDGNVNGSASSVVTIGKIGQALSFSESAGDYVRLNDGTQYDFSYTAPFSVSAWIKGGTGVNNDIIMANRDSWGYGWSFSTNGNKPRFFEYSDSCEKSISRSSNQSIDTTNWHHVVSTYNGVNRDGITLYIDGSAVTSYTDSGDSALTCSPTYTTNSVIGASDNGSLGHFNGSIDEVRVYNRAISASEITELYQQGQTKINASQANKLTSGLVGYWTFDGQDTNWGANTTNDRSGNGYNGTMTNMSTTTSPVPGVAGQALYFDGSDDKIVLGNNSGLSITGPITLSAWVNPNSTSGGTIITDENQYALVVSSGNGVQMPDRQDDSFFTTTGIVPKNTWSHIVGVFSGVQGDNMSGKSYIYVNGVSQSLSYNGVIWNSPPSSGGQTIGMRGSSAIKFNGKIDEVRVYNRALSASEVQELYNAGR